MTSKEDVKKMGGDIWRMLNKIVIINNKQNELLRYLQKIIEKEKYHGFLMVSSRRQINFSQQTSQYCRLWRIIVITLMI